MASIKILAPFILSWEGGYVENIHDAGGATNKGVTLGTWRKVGYDKDGDGDIDKADLRMVSEEDAVYRVMKPYYWDKVKGDELLDQGVANIMADWVWGSGVKTPVKTLQRLVGVEDDGIFGRLTLVAVNACDAHNLFDKIKEARRKFLDAIVARRPENKVFLKGWLRRLDSIGYDRLKCNGNEILTW